MPGNDREAQNRGLGPALPAFQGPSMPLRNPERRIPGTCSGNRLGSFPTVVMSA